MEYTVPTQKELVRCNFWYSPEHRCKLRGHFNNWRVMCPEHNLLEQRKADKKRHKDRRPTTIADGRKSRAKPKHEKVQEKPLPVQTEMYDHTAPWGCGLTDCNVCQSKPGYDEYMRKKFG